MSFTQEILVMATWIDYFFKIDSLKLDEEEFALRWRMAEYLLYKIKPIAGKKPTFS